MPEVYGVCLTIKVQQDASSNGIQFNLKEKGRMKIVTQRK